ncbi:50S ribosomal protein L10 [Planctomicrobium sp. SH668]|uniref:50S ribosomal protein L10 n=1 Tax=Planctomicrobium sp. SH668 TaxID=3448126 RepID=UPI003F5BD2A2
MSKPIKEMIIRDIRAGLGDRKDLLILDVSQMTAFSQNQLRLDMAKKGYTFLGVKNSLARLALKESGFHSLDGILEGPTTLVWGGEDIVGLSREISAWASKVDKASIKGGVVDGEGVGPDAVETISKGPSRLELIGQIAGLVLSPGARLAGALLGPGGKVAGAITTLSEKSEEGGDAA